MANGKSQTAENLVLDWLLVTGSPTRPDTCKVSLQDTAPTNTAVGTEISGTGYTAGGQGVTFDAASGGATTGHNSSALTWTNGSGGDWTIAGAVLHHAASGAPVAGDVMYWTDELVVTVPDGLGIEIAIDGIAVSET